MESGRYWNDSTDYLEHHGVLGMKWGVRRYQNADGSLTDKGKKRYYEGSTNRKKQAKGYQRRLNDLDEQYVHDNSRRIWNHNLGDSNGRKYEKLMAKGKDEKAAKVMGKIHQNVKDELSYAKSAKESEQLTWKLLAEANQKGFDVNSKECTRYEHRGSEFAAWFVGGVAPAAAMISLDMPDHMDTRGRSYKVRQSKNSVGTTTLKSRS